MELSWTIFFTTFASEDLAFFFGLFGVIDARLSALQFLLFYGGGVLLGDIGLYSLGAIGRRVATETRFPSLHRKIHVLLKNRPKAGAEELGSFDYFLALTRFLPGTRLPTYVFCGFSGYSLFRFALILTVSTLVYAGVGVGLLEVFGLHNQEEVSSGVKVLLSLSSGLVTMFLFKFVGLMYRDAQLFGHPLAYLRFRIVRKFFPEFWSTLLLYIPLIPYFAYLAIRYGGAKILFAINPRIYSSGLVGELKSDIEPLIAEGAPAQQLAFLQVGKKTCDELVEAIEHKGLKFPMIIKPDNGLRGQDVSLVEDMKGLTKALGDNPEQYVLQEYHKGEFEWGVYYYRLPSKSRGGLYSVTNKIMPSVVGDGESSLLDLMLRDPLLRLRADIILRDNQDLSASSIPANGEKIQLVFKGSHSKGCLFFDESQWIGTDIEAGITQVLDRFEGLHFGRLDIKFYSLEELKQGKFKILEINGIGAESTNLYNPGYSYAKVAEILMGQWSLACQIGYQNLHNESYTDRLGFWDLMFSLYKNRKVMS